MTGSMYAAVAGLKAHMTALNVIGNNVSNVNTLGYKTTRYTFNEALYTTNRSGSDGSVQAGGRNPAQIGFGANIGTIDLDMSSKNYTPTGKALDTMIDGDGFFIVGDKSTGIGDTAISANDTPTLKGMNLTRLGNFTIDPNGYLVDGNGSVVWGFLERSLSSEELTEYNAADADISNLHNIVRNDANEITSATITVPALTAFRLPMTEEVTTGTPPDETTTKVVRWPSFTAATEGDSTADPPVPARGPQMDDAEGANVARLEADTVSINEKTGAITIMTSDEQLLVVGYLAIAKVTNPDGVTHVDGRYYQALEGAGEVRLTAIKSALEGVGIESAGDTKLVTGGLESSGTDLATEITNMITVQRGYQANTRIVTVTDSMLEELVNMKR